jgi:hypothetical protein
MLVPVHIHEKFIQAKINLPFIASFTLEVFIVDPYIYMLHRFIKNGIFEAMKRKQKKKGFSLREKKRYVS